MKFDTPSPEDFAYEDLMDNYDPYELLSEEEKRQFDEDYFEWLRETGQDVPSDEEISGMYAQYLYETIEKNAESQDEDALRSDIVELDKLIALGDAEKYPPTPQYSFDGFPDKQPSLTLTSEERMMKIYENLASRIDKWVYDLDPYEYKDQYGEEGAYREQILSEIIKPGGLYFYGFQMDKERSNDFDGYDISDFREILRLRQDREETLSRDDMKRMNISVYKEWEDIKERCDEAMLRSEALESQSWTVHNYLERENYDPETVDMNTLPAYMTRDIGTQSPFDLMELSNAEKIEAKAIKTDFFDDVYAAENRGFFMEKDVVDALGKEYKEYMDNKVSEEQASRKWSRGPAEAILIRHDLGIDFSKKAETPVKEAQEELDKDIEAVIESEKNIPFMQDGFDEKKSDIHLDERKLPDAPEVDDDQEMIDTKRKGWGED